MGICLDTEHSDDSPAFEEGTASWAQNTPRQRTQHGAAAPITNSSAGHFPMHNETHIQFEAPKAPVIFVLGGPGSGKVTHCDNLMQEKKEIVHINMSDLLQQYAIGNDIADYGQLSSRTVTEVLMVEMKMAPNAKTYIVSGYPRNMRDVVEYAEKIQMINGVILISWRQKVLERQIDYGAKLGQVVLSLAKMELSNFYKNVVPVAEYFAQSKMLVKIHGERPPTEVYKDFRDAFFEILNNQDNPPVFTNGTTIKTNNNEIRPKTQVISVSNNTSTVPNFNSPVKPLTYPPVLWIIGGPGSNKSTLCAEISKDCDWTHISLGRLLRAACESTATSPESNKIRENVTNGNLVPFDLVMKILDEQMDGNVTAKGLIIDGFPRNIEQVHEFENKYKQKPTIILLDCSKLQLGKGRLDDSVTAFRRRLEVFREASLPMLKAMDNIGRLTIVDGDTDNTAVREDFKNVAKAHIEYMVNSEQSQLNHVGNGHIPNGHVTNGDATIVDLEPASITPIDTAKHNNGINHITAKITNGMSHLARGVVKVGDVHSHDTINYMEGHI